MRSNISGAIFGEVYSRQHGLVPFLYHSSRFINWVSTSFSSFDSPSHFWWVIDESYFHLLPRNIHYASTYVCILLMSSCTNQPRLLLLTWKSSGNSFDITIWLVALPCKVCTCQRDSMRTVVPPPFFSEFVCIKSLLYDTTYYTKLGAEQLLLMIHASNLQAATATLLFGTITAQGMFACKASQINRKGRSSPWRLNS